MADESHTEATPLKPLDPSAGGGADEERSSSTKNNPSKYEKFVPGLSNAKREIAKGDNSPKSKASAVLKGFEVCCGSIFVTILMMILSALPIAMIVIGAKYLHQCPGRDKIPIWLIVFGCFALLQTIINGMRRCTETYRVSNLPDESEYGEPSAASRGGGCCEGLVSLFLFAWLIVGSVWVFSYWTTYTFSSSCVQKELCCHPVPYWFSFITLIVIYAGALLSLLICCCCCCCIGSVLF